jgi:hypothetical protein
MKKIMTVIVLAYCVLYLGSSRPYERQIAPPVETNPFLCDIQGKPERSLIPLVLAIKSKKCQGTQEQEEV